MNINFTKINGNLYKINNQNNIKFTNVIVPFKLQKYYENYYLNIEINHNDKLNQENIYIYKLLENELYNLEKIEDNNLTNLEFYSNIKTKTYKNNTFDLLRLQIKKSKNSFITKYKNGTLFEIEPNKKYNCEIEINTIWISKNKYGFNINLINLENN